MSFFRDRIREAERKKQQIEKEQFEDPLSRSYEEQKEFLSPYHQFGVESLGRLREEIPDSMRTFTLADFYADPGYQFRLQEGQKAVSAALNRKGLRQSTAAVKALDEYTQGMASNEFDRAYNRFNQDRDSRFNKLFATTGLGQGQSMALSDAANQYATNLTNMRVGRYNMDAARHTADQDRKAQRTNSFMGMLGMLGGGFLGGL